MRSTSCDERCASSSSGAAHASLFACRRASDRRASNGRTRASGRSRPAARVRVSRGKQGSRCVCRGSAAVALSDRVLARLTPRVRGDLGDRALAGVVEPAGGLELLEAHDAGSAAAAPAARSVGTGVERHLSAGPDGTHTVSPTARVQSASGSLCCSARRVKPLSSSPGAAAAELTRRSLGAGPRNRNRGPGPAAVSVAGDSTCCQPGLAAPRSAARADGRARAPAAVDNALAIEDASKIPTVGCIA